MQARRWSTRAGRSACGSALAAFVGAFAAACGDKTSEPLARPQLDYVSGNNQEAPQGAPLPAPFVVRALDGHGTPYPGVEVRWITGDGLGFPTDTITRTDGSGIASLTIRLAKRPGPVVTVARLVSEVSAEVRFDVTAKLTTTIADTVTPATTDTIVLSCRSWETRSRLSRVPRAGSARRRPDDVGSGHGPLRLRC